MEKIKILFPKVSIVIVNYNGLRFLNECLFSLYNLNYPGPEPEIILIDNNSSDESVSFVKKNYPSVKIIVNEINNYCRAINLGCEASSSDYLITLNNDTRVEKNWLLELVRVILRDEKIAAVGSKVLFNDGRINSVGHKALPNDYWSDLGFKEQDMGQFDNIEELESVSGVSCIYRKAYLKQAGLFDEDFHMYFEDVDVNFRLRKQGFKIFLAPLSIVYHHFHGTAQEEFVRFQIEKNRLLFLAKHFPEKLGASLMGSGYFIFTEGEKTLRDFYMVLPLVLNKLFKHHPQEAGLYLKDIFSNLQKISNVEKDKLKQLLEEKATLIEDSKRSLENLKEEIKQRDLILQEKDVKFQLLSNQLGQLSAELELLRSELKKTQQELDSKNLSLDELNQCYHKAISELESKTKLLEQKGVLLAQKDKQLEMLHGQIKDLQLDLERIKQELMQKESYLKKITQDHQGVVAELNLKIGLLEQKDLLLAQRDNQLQQLHKEIERLEIKLEEKNLALAKEKKLVEEQITQIKKLQQEREAFYSSETFIFLISPLWQTLDFLKKIKKIIFQTFSLSKRTSHHSKQIKNGHEEKKIKFLRKIRFGFFRKKSLFISYFITNMNRANYAISNQYFLKITNISPKVYRVGILIEFLRGDKNNKENLYASFLREIEILPKSGIELKIDYDWKDKFYLYNGNEIGSPDSLKKKVQEPEEGRFYIRASLVDKGAILEKMQICQILKK